jgi:hypothetical protein
MEVMISAVLGIALCLSALALLLWRFLFRLALALILAGLFMPLAFLLYVAFGLHPP